MERGAKNDEVLFNSEHKLEKTHPHAHINVHSVHYRFHQSPDCVFCSKEAEMREATWNDVLMSLGGSVSHQIAGVWGRIQMAFCK